MENFDLREWSGFEEAGGDDRYPAIVEDIVIDSRGAQTKKTLFVALSGKTSDGHHYLEDIDAKGVRYALVQKGYQLSKPLQNTTLLYVDSTLKAFQEIAAVYRRKLPTKIVAITGSKGKTLVKDLLVNIVSKEFYVGASPESFNSCIGVPLSLLGLESMHQIAFIEAGVSKPGEMDVLTDIIRPDCAILTTIAHTHLSDMKSVYEIVQEKSKLLAAVDAEGWVVHPKGEHFSKSHFLGRSFCWEEIDPLLPYAKIVDKDVKKDLFYKVYFPEGDHFKDQIHGHYKYFIEIVNIAIRAAWLLGASRKAIIAGLRNYLPKTQQIEIWRSKLSKATFINEPYCEDPLSLQRALKHFDQSLKEGKKIFAFGGIQKATPRSLNYAAKAISNADLDQLVLFDEGRFSGVQDYCSPKIVRQLASTNILRDIEELAGKDDTVVIKGLHKIEIGEFVGYNKLVVDLDAVRDNIGALQSALVEDSKLMVMIKASGYGTDSLLLGQFLEKCGVDMLGVAHLNEAIALRQGGITADIFVLHVASFEAEQFIKWNLQCAISGWEDLRGLEEVADSPLKVHLHIDTGMRRLGCRPKEALELALALESSPKFQLEGVMTHLAAADDPEHDDFTHQQVKIFRGCLEQLHHNNIFPPLVHVANTAGVTRFSWPFCNMARVGIGALGLYPSKACRGKVELTPSLTLHSRIMQITECLPGETVSYGCKYVVGPHKQKIAVVPLGYFDGIHRHYSGKGHVLVRGCHAPMVGTVCMDFMMIDVSQVPHCEVGDEVLLFGEDDYGHTLPAETFAEFGNSIPYELITCLGQRIQRIFTYSN
ncbi:MAG: alanine racemase [Chlamydiota bacterium]